MAVIAGTRFGLLGFCCCLLEFIAVDEDCSSPSWFVVLVWKIENIPYRGPGSDEDNRLLIAEEDGIVLNSERQSSIRWTPHDCRCRCRQCLGGAKCNIDKAIITCPNLSLWHLRRNGATDRWRMPLRLNPTGKKETSVCQLLKPPGRLFNSVA